MEEANEQVPVTPAPQAEPLPTEPLKLPAALAVCAAAWLIPGLGHVLLGRWIRGIIFAASVFLLFLTGIATEGKLYDLAFEQPLHLFAFIANLGAGLLYIVTEYFQAGIGRMTAPSFDYGTTFLWVCGLLNYLIVLDAFDIAQGRKP